MSFPKLVIKIWHSGEAVRHGNTFDFRATPKKEPLGVLPPRVHTGVGARHALFPIDWLFGAWTNLSTHPAFCFGCQFPDAIHHPRFTAGEKFRPHSRAAATIPDRSLLSEASLPGSVLTCR